MPPPSKRRRTLEEAVNKLEGEAMSETEVEDVDDLDIVATVRKELASPNGNVIQNAAPQQLSSAATSETEAGDAESSKSGSTAKRKDGKFKRTMGRLEWSDDDDDIDTTLQQLREKLSKRKGRPPKGESKSRTVKPRGGKSSIVGRRPRKAVVDGRLTKGQQNWLDRQSKDNYVSDNDEDAMMEDTLPDYVRNRRTGFDELQKELGEAGLKLPPSYEDVYFSDDERLADLREKPYFPGVKPPGQYRDIEMPTSGGVIPASIAQWLREYQMKGAEFMHGLFVRQKGGILGDDMGLGKTIQVIAFLTAAFGKTGDERDAKRMRKMRRMRDDRWYPKVLLICPGTLLENWKSELDTWGWWQIYQYHGKLDERENAIQAARSGRLEIMITTYDTYRLGREEINLTEWDCVVADECHRIKDKAAKITQAMNDVNALCRIGLTGTAIQNKYEELWTLLNWTNPGRFGPLATWKEVISKPLKAGQSHDATVTELGKARETAELLVKNLLPPFFLRRMKSLIADQLPKKKDRVVFCPLTDTQADAYKNIVDSDIVEYIRRSAEPCDCGSGGKRGWCCYTEIEGYGKWQFFVFPCMATLQKLSNHLAMLVPTGTEAEDKRQRALAILETATPHLWKELWRKKDKIEIFAQPEFCGKWRVLKKLLRFWHSNGDKVLVFSHSVRLLKMLHSLFSSTTYNVSFLDGSMSYEERQKTVDDFNANPMQFVFLISTKAGGMGLNITSANKVVVFDPNWNPAYDLQAQDRAYRIGQTRDVEVFRLISTGTIEEIVYARQIYKQQQASIGYNASLERRYFKGVQDDKAKKGEIFGLVNIFSFQGENIVLREIVNKTNIAESKADVTVLGLDLSQTDDMDDEHIGGQDEDYAMSQLAELITSGENEAKSKNGSFNGHKGKADPINAILASAGVQYTHENSEVIGTSKIEEKLSRRAQEAGKDIDMIGEHVFQHGSQSQGDFVPKSQLAGYDSADDSDLGDGDLDAGLTKTRDGRISWKNIKFKYRPPEDVRRRQFCTMAKTFGFDDPVEFALVVEGWTQEQRRNCLDKFYRIRRARILELGRKGQGKIEEASMEEDGASAAAAAEASNAAVNNTATDVWTL